MAVHAGLTVHLRVLEGRNDHHKLEALFKAFGLALRYAAAPSFTKPDTYLIFASCRALTRRKRTYDFVSGD